MDWGSTWPLKIKRRIYTTFIIPWVLIVTSSAVDKKPSKFTKKNLENKLEIYKKNLEIKLEIYKNLEIKLEIYKNLENKLEIYSYFKLENKLETFEFFVNGR